MVDVNKFKRLHSTEALALVRDMMAAHDAGAAKISDDIWDVIADVWDGEAEFWKKAADLARQLHLAELADSGKLLE